MQSRNVTRCSCRVTRAVNVSACARCRRDRTGHVISQHVFLIVHPPTVGTATSRVCRHMQSLRRATACATVVIQRLPSLDVWTSAVNQLRRRKGGIKVAGKTSNTAARTACFDSATGIVWFANTHKRLPTSWYRAAAQVYRHALAATKWVTTQMCSVSSSTLPCIFSRYAVHVVYLDGQEHGRRGCINRDGLDDD